MGNRLTKIYTRTGDAGDTGLADGSRISKQSARVQAMGDVDELNSVLGLLVCKLHAPAHVQLVQSFQNELFNLGAELSTNHKFIKLITPGFSNTARRHEHCIIAVEGIHPARWRRSCRGVPYCAHGLPSRGTQPGCTGRRSR